MPWSWSITRCPPTAGRRSLRSPSARRRPRPPELTRRSAEITALRERYLGPVLRAGSGTRNVPAELHPELLARTRFGRPERILLPGRKDLTRDIDDVVANVLSQSFSAPHLFGTRLDRFTADLRQLLTVSSPTGWFWEWPGDTEVLIARKRAAS